MNDFWEDDRIKEGEKSAREVVAGNYLREAIPHLKALRKWAPRMSDGTLAVALFIVNDVCDKLNDELEKRIAEQEKGDRASDRQVMPSATTTLFTSIPQDELNDLF